MRVPSKLKKGRKNLKFEKENQFVLTKKLRSMKT